MTMMAVTSLASPKEQCFLFCCCFFRIFSLKKKKESQHFGLSLIRLAFLLQVERGIDLVYGGGSIGLMGLVSHAVHDGGRHVIG
jgi:hypothetical protein